MNLRFSLLLLLDPLGEDPPGLVGNCSTFKSELDKVMSIVTSLLGSVSDLCEVKGSLCDTGVVATGLISPVKIIKYFLNNSY